MKKRILAILLPALLVVNISSCNFGSQSEIEEPFENIDTTGSNFEETDEKITESETNEADKKITESETNAEIKPTRKGPTFCNGVWGNSTVTYTFNQNREFSLYIADWDEDHLVTSLSDKDINAVKYSATAIIVNNERAFLLLKRFYEPTNKITVVSFEKDSQSETVLNLNIDEAVYEFSGNFINEKVGYLFAFKEVSEGHSRGGSKLSNLFKTEDGGNTWNSINVQNVPSISLREHIIFAKMISEDVGIISGDYGGADYNFCERTLLTTDGGLHWVNITALPQIDGFHAASIADFIQDGDSYILTIRQKDSGIEYVCTYKSLDLNTWLRIN